MVFGKDSNKVFSDAQWKVYDLIKDSNPSELIINKKELKKIKKELVEQLDLK